jgi:hypothetical protein
MRRYVLLRHPGAGAARWSIERVAPAPRGGSAAAVTAQRSKRRGARS